MINTIRKMTNDTKCTMIALRAMGYKWTICTPVGYNHELHNEITLENGRELVMFIAEIDSYGNITKWGIPEEAKEIAILGDGPMVNADGDTIQ